MTFKPKKKHVVGILTTRESSNATIRYGSFKATERNKTIKCALKLLTVFLSYRKGWFPVCSRVFESGMI